MNKSKWTKVGNIQKKKDGSGFYITLGNTKSKFKPFSVKLVVTDEKGGVVTEVENPLLSIQDPRKNPNLKEGQAERIPTWLINELFVVERS